MSDVDIIFREALKIDNEKEAVDYIFSELPDIDPEEIIKLWTSFLQDNKQIKHIRKIQTGGTMASQLPYNSVFRGKITDLY